MGNNLVYNGFWFYSKGGAILACALSLLFLMYGVGVGAALSAEPIRSQAAQGGDCTACHGGDGKVPEGHVNTKGMDIKQCLGCHKEGAPKLVNTLPLSHSHLLSGVSCAGCHKEATPPEFVGTDQCISCHKLNDLVEATKDNKEANPHNSPHYGPELDCDLCHHAHETSENFCSECHDFKFIIPSPMAKPAKRTALSKEQKNSTIAVRPATDN